MREPAFWHRPSSWISLVLSPLGALSIRLDREENLWIGTSGGGLMRFKPRRASTIGPESGLSERVVRSVAPDASGGVWIATYGKGLFRWRENALTPFVPGDGKNTESYVQSVYEDRSGRVWIGLYTESVRVFDARGTRLVVRGPFGGANVSSISRIRADASGWVPGRA